MGIEPTYPAWKAGVLPLNYARGFAFSLEIITSYLRIVNIFVGKFRYLCERAEIAVFYLQNTMIVTPLLLRSKSLSWRRAGQRAKASRVAALKMENSSPGMKSRITRLSFCWLR